MRSRLKYLQIIFIAAVFVFLAIRTWRKCADLLVDFGVQLYIPWQLASGKTLYHDVAYLPGGPFSQYFNAGLFKIFGVSFTVLIVANLIIAAILAITIYRFFQKISDSTTAAAIVFAVVSVFTFSELIFGRSNYNYICPYSHEALHGLLLSIFAICFLSRWISKSSLSAISLAGFCFGCVFMTKPEVFLSLAATTMAAFIIRFYRQEKLQWKNSIAAFAVASLIPLLIFFLFFRQTLNSKDSSLAVVWAWVPLLTTKAADNDFYRWCMGLDHPWGNMALAFVEAAGFAVCAVLVAWACRAETKERPDSKWIRIIAIALAFYAVIQANWHETGRAFLFLAPAILGFFIWLWWKNRLARKQVPILLWATFACFLAVKMGFNSRIWHYGFYSAMPEAALVIFFTFAFLPDAFPGWKIRKEYFRFIFFVFLIIAAGKLWMISGRNYDAKDFAVGSGDDKILALRQPTGRATQEAVQWILNNSTSNATMAVLPEGAMLNFLSRRANSTPYVNFMLPEWQTFGSNNILQAFKTVPPDFIVLVHKDTSEYGVSYFGQSEIYGAALMKWIKENYISEALFGSEPLQDERFGIKILKRKNS